jgi:hypothetical protein
MDARTKLAVLLGSAARHVQDRGMKPEKLDFARGFELSAQADMICVWTR